MVFVHNELDLDVPVQMSDFTARSCTTTMPNPRLADSSLDPTPATCQSLDSQSRMIMHKPEI